MLTREGEGVPEKTMFVHMGEGGLEACPLGQKLLSVTRFLYMNSKKAVRIFLKIVFVNELLVCHLNSYTTNFWDKNAC